MSVPFYTANAFTTSLFGGNPAATVFLNDKSITTDVLQNIAKNLNQPIVTFLWPGTQTKPDPAIATYDVRWFTITQEVALCGHGTLAAAGTLFSIPSLLPETVTAIHFKTLGGHDVTARKSGELVEISLVAIPTESPTPEEAEKVAGIVRKALGEDVNVKHMGIGVRGFHYKIFIEIEEGNNLAERKPNTSAFSGSGYQVHIITSTSPHPNIDFVSRMFAPDAGVPEDHVCGSAHAMIGPYWAAKLGKKEMVAKQVSPRGGDLKVRVHEGEGLVTLGGQVVITAQGSLML